MIRYTTILKKATQMAAASGRNPFTAARQNAILIRREALDEACKGFFVSYCRSKAITLRDNMSEALSRVVCAHELGHAVLHPNDADVYGRGISDTKEREANLFAAEFLLDDDEVLALLKELDLYALAGRLNVPGEIVSMKLEMMRHKGTYTGPIPLDLRADFMKEVQDGHHG